MKPIMLIIIAGLLALAAIQHRNYAAERDKAAILLIEHERLASQLVWCREARLQNGDYGP